MVWPMRYVMRQRMFSLADSFQIKDEAGRDAFVVSGKVFSLAKQLSFQDLEGNELLAIKQELMTFAPAYEIFQGDAAIAEVKKQMFNIFNYRFSIDLPGAAAMEAAGNFLDHEYVIGRAGVPVATVSKQWFTMTDTYGVDITASEDDVLILAITVVIDMVCHPDRK